MCLEKTLCKSMSVEEDRREDDTNGIMLMFCLPPTLLGDGTRRWRWRCKFTRVRKRTKQRCWHTCNELADADEGSFWRADEILSWSLCLITSADGLVDVAKFFSLPSSMSSRPTWTSGLASSTRGGGHWILPTRIGRSSIMSSRVWDGAGRCRSGWPVVDEGTTGDTLGGTGTSWGGGGWGRSAADDVGATGTGAGTLGGTGTSWGGIGRSGSAAEDGRTTGAGGGRLGGTGTSCDGSGLGGSAAGNVGATGAGGGRLWGAGTSWGSSGHDRPAAEDGRATGAGGGRLGGTGTSWGGGGLGGSATDEGAIWTCGGTLAGTDTSWGGGGGGGGAGIPTASTMSLMCAVWPSTLCPSRDGDRDFDLAPSEFAIPGAANCLWLLTSLAGTKLGAAWEYGARQVVEAAGGATGAGGLGSPTVITVGLKDVDWWLTVTGVGMLVGCSDAWGGNDAIIGCWCNDCLSSSFWRCWASSSAWRAMFSRCSCYNTLFMTSCKYTYNIQSTNGFCLFRNEIQLQLDRGKRLSKNHILWIVGFTS